MRICDSVSIRTSIILCGQRVIYPCCETKLNFPVEADNYDDIALRYFAFDDCWIYSNVLIKFC